MHFVNAFFGFQRQLQQVMGQVRCNDNKIVVYKQLLYTPVQFAVMHGV